MEWFIKKGKGRKEKRRGRTGGEVEKRGEELKGRAQRGYKECTSGEGEKEGSREGRGRRGREVWGRRGRAG
jgi:hypothetical protein